MEKVYKSRIYRVILNLVYGTFAAGVAFFIAGIWLKTTIAILIAVGIFLSYMWLIVLSNLITVTVSDKYLTVKKGRRQQRFEIARCSFHAKMVTSSGDTSCELDITDESGKKHYIDCELIGAGQFESLLEDLGIIGEHAPVQKIQTKKGE